MPPTPRRSGLAALAASTALATAVLAAPVRHGETVEVQGVVSDATGSALADVEVILEARRVLFSLRRLASEQRDVARRSTRTGPDGQYALSWRYDRYFNRFSLIAAVPEERRRPEEWIELARADLDGRLTVGGGPVVVPLTVADPAPLDAFRRFVAGLAGEDQPRIYAEQGRPDEVTRGTWEGAPEESWWYFAAGRVYRFRSDRLAETEEFPPVEPR